MTKMCDVSGVGLGLRRQFAEEVAKVTPDEIDFFEIAPENYIGRGGVLLDCLERIADKRPIIAHGLSLSIGGTDDLNWGYLKKLKTFLRDWKIPWFSDHLCFSSHNAHEFHDLLPLPFTREALLHVSERARAVQDFLEVPFALENVSFYYHPAKPEMSELDFLLEILERSGVHLMLDVNNAFVNSINHGTNARNFLAGLPHGKILQIHIAGHFRESENFVIDTHGEAVCQDVWSLLEGLGETMALPPILIERDNNIPTLDEILREVGQAKTIYEKSRKTNQIYRGTVYDARKSASTMDCAATNLHDIQNFFLKLCTDVSFDDSEENLRRIAPNTIANHLMRIPKERLLTYRRLTTANIENLLKKTFPLLFRWIPTETRMQLMRLFLSEKIQSNQYRQIPQEFINFLNRDSQSKSFLTKRLLQLADYELAEYDLIFNDALQKPLSIDPNTPLENARLVLNPALVLKCYDYPVHAVSETNDPASLPDKESPVLLYRDPLDFKICSLRLSPNSYIFLEVFSNTPQRLLTEGLEEMTSRLPQPDPQGFIRECLEFLKTLIDKRIVIALMRNDQ